VIARAQRSLLPLAIGVGTLALSVAIVEVLIRVGVVNRFIVPMPSQIAGAFERVILEEDIPHRFLVTAREAFWATMLLALVGVSIGVLLHRVKLLRDATETWVAAMASAPTVLMYPLFLVIFGRSERTIIMMGFVAVLPAVILKTIEGSAGTRRVLIDVGRSFKLSQTQLFWKIYFPGRAADDLRRPAPRHDLRADQHRRRRVPDQFRRARPTHQRPRGTLRPPRHLCVDLLRRPGQRHLLLPHRSDRAMAETGRLTAPAAPCREPGDAGARRDHRAILLTWEAVAASGLLFRDVVPSLIVIGRALVELLTEAGLLLASRRHRRARSAARLLIGGLAGLAVGITLGANPLLSRSVRGVPLLSRADAKDHLLPGHDHVVRGRPRLEGRDGRAVVFLPVALSAAAGMRGIDKVLIRVGRSFRASTWQMVTKIYLPAMRMPILNGVRLGLGVAIIGTLLAETKLSNRGLGFLIINAYSTFNMPRMYALLIVLFVLSIGVNALIGRLGGVDSRRTR
jgi:ABC-type nitrate/sulfonate/bicarbonate transport system permease component